MNEKSDGNWTFDAVGEDDPFADKPFDETAFAVPTAESAPEQPVQAPPVHSIPESAPAEASVPAQASEDAETQKRAAHEAAEAARKAEFDARKAEKKQAMEQKISQIKTMTNDEAMNAAIKRAGADTEKLTRRNMMELVTEHIQTMCIEDPGFARLTLHPRKSMIRCFQYIKRKAWDYVQDELKLQGIKPGPGMQTYGADIPDDVCYQWAEEYFRDPTAKEDQEEEEIFVAKPYPGASASKSKKTAPKKPAQTKKNEPKPEAKKTEPAKQEDEQMSFTQLSMV